MRSAQRHNENIIKEKYILLDFKIKNPFRIFSKEYAQRKKLKSYTSE